jgi:hypothetical protein
LFSYSFLLSGSALHAVSGGKDLASGQRLKFESSNLEAILLPKGLWLKAL